MLCCKIMMKIKKSNQINLKAEALNELEEKLSSTQKKDDEDKIPEDIDEWTDDPVRWNGFKERYADEFENKLNMMDSIMNKKKNRLKVTWISIFKKN